MSGRGVKTRQAMVSALFMALLCVPMAVLAEVMVVAESGNHNHREFIAALGADAGDRIEVFDINGALPLERDWEAVIAVGGRAGIWVEANRPGRRRLYAMVPEAAARDWLEGEHDDGLFLDTDPRFVVQLLQVALSGVKTVRVLVGPNTAVYGERMATVARAAGLTPHVLEVNTEPGEAEFDSNELEAIFAVGEAVVVAADPVVLNRETVVPLIRGAYLRDRPLIAHSESAVRAGALMALHSTPQRLGREAGDWLLGHAGRWTPYAGDYELSVNYGVARALGLDLPGERELKRRLDEEMGP